MPRKRPLDIRLSEATAKMDDLKLEKAIEDLRTRRIARKPAKRRRRASQIGLF